jgi:DNA-binding transcriptional ArsR family regulator
MPTFESIAASFSSPIRTEAFYLLVREGPLTMSRLAGKLGISASTATAHVAVMREAGLVESWRSGREVLVDAVASDVELVVTPLDPATRAIPAVDRGPLATDS